MANVLIISGSYFPYATANAVCVKKFEDVLKSHGHKVIYCNRKHDLYEPDYHIYEGTELYTVGKNSDLFFQTIHKLNGLSLPNNMQGCFALSNRIFRILMKLRNIGKNKSRLRETASDFYINQYAGRIASIIEKENIDVIMSVSMPFDSHKAALKAINKLKSEQKKTPKWIAYCIDAYWSKAGIPKIDIPQKKQEEKEVFTSCDMILLLDTLLNDFASKDFDYCRSKFKPLPLPLFDLKQEKTYNDGIKYDSTKLNFVYTGTIYDKYSNVDALAEIIRNLPASSIFHLMGKIYPTSLAVLEELSRDYNGRILMLGRRSYDYAKGSMQKADILINLANDNANQIPSKIFEYIACCKPILNIYKCADDVGTKYLKQYPLAFNFNVQDMDNELIRLSVWLKSISRQAVSFERIESIYKDILTPTVINNFYNLIKPILSTTTEQ